MLLKRYHSIETCPVTLAVVMPLPLL